MVKYISMFSLKPGKFTPDEAWKYWREKHTRWAREKLVPDIKKYVIGRVVDTFGDTEAYGVVQMWYEDAATARKAMQRVFDSPPDEFQEILTNPRRVIIEEEEVEL